MCEGAADKINDFIDVIDLHEENIFVENILKGEVEDASPIPMTFARLETDTLEAIGRKPDKGVARLKSIKKNTVVLHEHTGLLKDLKSGQDKIVKVQDKMIEVLEKIAEK